MMAEDIDDFAAIGGGICRPGLSECVDPEIASAGLRCGNVAKQPGTDRRSATSRFPAGLCNPTGKSADRLRADLQSGDNLLPFADSGVHHLRTANPNHHSGRQYPALGMDGLGMELVVAPALLQYAVWVGWRNPYRPPNSGIVRAQSPIPPDPDMAAIGNIVHQTIVRRRRLALRLTVPPGGPTIALELAPATGTRPPANRPGTGRPPTQPNPGRPGQPNTKPGTTRPPATTKPAQPRPTQPNGNRPPVNKPAAQPKPAQPGTRPAQPNTRPTQPNTRPTQPNTKPTQPNTRPAQPKPAQPNARPVQPKPAQPNTRPVQPKPAQPNTKPAPNTKAPKPSPKPAQPQKSGSRPPPQPKPSTNRN